MSRYEKNRKSICVALPVSDLEWLKEKCSTWNTSLADLIRYSVKRFKWESENENKQDNQ